MSRFQDADRETPYLMPPSIQEWLPRNHLARFVVDVVAELNLKPIYDSYAGRGSAAVDPRILVALLFYGYATGTFSSRKLERASYESIPVRYICGNTHPDHDTIAAFRKRFLKEIETFFVEILVIARELELLKLGNVSIDGSKIKANASKHSAMSYAHAVELEKRLTNEVKRLLSMAEKTDKEETATLDIPAEIERREERLKKIRMAKAEIEKRAAQRDEINRVEYEAKLEARRRAAETTGQKPRGKEPKPPATGPKETDQYNFTDPESAIMKSGSTGAFEQDYNCQLAVDQDSMLIVACTLSNHANDKRELLPVLDAIPAVLGKPQAVAADTGYFSKNNIDGCQFREIESFIATGRESHYPTIEKLLEPSPPMESISIANLEPAEAMAMKLKTSEGKKIFGQRKSTVEPAFGVIKQAMGFRQFLLRGLENVAGEWSLVCSGFNLKRLYNLQMGACI
jgi:transposase